VKRHTIWVTALALLAACAESAGTGPSLSTPAPATAIATTTATPAPTSASTPTSTPDSTDTGAGGAAPHVFVIVLENTSYVTTFGEGSAAPYLARDLTAQGALLTQYHAVAHPSLPNYLAMVSGQAPNPSTQTNCVVYSDFVPTGTGEWGQALGDGCVYPATVPTIGDQLTAAGLSWKAYGEDMAASPTAPAACRRPEIGTEDTSQRARVGDDYATRHMPFLYFHSIIDSPTCADHVVDLNVLATDMAALATTPHLAFIVPDLCSDAHDATCADGTEGGLPEADRWLREWVPMILASPAFLDGGLLIITFDEAATGGATADSTACCGSGPAPNLDGPAGRDGPGGGRVGAVVIGAAVRPGTITEAPYNHYSLLCSLERLWGLEPLGYAGHPDTPCFGPDVYTQGAPFATG
jgi:hypothetical protein